jgi:hypothetical protein
MGRPVLRFEDQPKVGLFLIGWNIRVNGAEAPVGLPATGDGEEIVSMIRAEVNITTRTKRLKNEVDKTGGD